MKVAIFSARPDDRLFFAAANRDRGDAHDLRFINSPLTPATLPLAVGCGAVCPFVNDAVDRAMLDALHAAAIRLVAIRGTGFDHVDLDAAAALGIMVARVPTYSPYAVAEHAMALILALNRKTHRAYARVRDGNFSLDGLLGFDIHLLTAGIVGTGRIGMALAHILAGFGCTLLGSDPTEDPTFLALGGTYLPLDQLLARADIVSLHCPLTPQTRRLIDANAIERMKKGVMLINTSRGAVIDTDAVIDALLAGHIGHLGLDVYEKEAGLFFQDLSGTVIADDMLARLLTLPNVLLTGHQAFFTSDAVMAIAETTLANVTAFERTGRPLHEVAAGPVALQGIL